jgi:hypothetical protein
MYINLEEIELLDRITMKKKSFFFLINYKYTFINISKYYHLSMCMCSTLYVFKIATSILNIVFG